MAPFLIRETLWVKARLAFAKRPFLMWGILIFQSFLHGEPASGFCLTSLLRHCLSFSGILLTTYCPALGPPLGLVPRTQRSPSSNAQRWLNPWSPPHHHLQMHRKWPSRQTGMHWPGTHWSAPLRFLFIWQWNCKTFTRWRAKIALHFKEQSFYSYIQHFENEITNNGHIEINSKWPLWYCGPNFWVSINWFRNFLIIFSAGAGTTVRRGRHLLGT